MERAARPCYGGTLSLPYVSLAARPSGWSPCRGTRARSACTGWPSGYHPGRRLPPARRFADAGALSAHRFRQVAAALERRAIRFQCRGQPAAHPNRNAAVPRELGGLPNRGVIWLYPRYWSRTRPVRLGILIHEALHLFSPVGDQDTAPRRGLNAHCYEWLALVLDGLAAEPSDLYSCHLTPPG
jgi:hypothetical protein